MFSRLKEEDILRSVRVLQDKGSAVEGIALSVRVLAGLVDNNPELHDAMVGAGVIPALAGVLQNKSLDGHIKLYASFGLLNLVKFNYEGIYKYQDADRFSLMLQGKGASDAQFFAIQLVFLAMCGESDDQAASKGLLGMIPQLLKGFSFVPYPISCDIFMRTESGRKVLSLLWDGADESIKEKSTEAFCNSMSKLSKEERHWIARRSFLSGPVIGTSSAVTTLAGTDDSDLCSLFLDRRMSQHKGSWLTSAFFGVATTFLSSGDLKQAFPGDKAVGPREKVEDFVSVYRSEMPFSAHDFLGDDAAPSPY